MENENVKTYFTKKDDGDMRSSSENRMAFLCRNGLSKKQDVLMKQVHGSKIVIVDDGYITQECDGLITKRKDVVLFVNVADCLPILFFDPIKEVIAVAHAGRNGSFQNISGKMIKMFIESFHSDPKDIFVKIGPGINTCCYEVCAESYDYCDYVKENFGEEFVYGKNINIHGINEKQLLYSGVLKENIFHEDICTMCCGDKKYFSFRCGDIEKRFAGIITLN